MLKSPRAPLYAVIICPRLAGVISQHMSSAFPFHLQNDSSREFYNRRLANLRLSLKISKGSEEFRGEQRLASFENYISRHVETISQVILS